MRLGPRELVLVPLLVPLLAAQTHGGLVGAGVCTALLQQSSAGSRAVMKHGKEKDLSVRWAAQEGAAGRARAALLVAALRRLGYARVYLHPPDAQRYSDTLHIVVKAKDTVHTQPRLQARPRPGCARGASDTDSRCAYLSVLDLPPEWKRALARSQEAGEAEKCAQCTVLVAANRLKDSALLAARRAACAGRSLRVLLQEPLVALIAHNNYSLLFFAEPLRLYDRDVHDVDLPPCCDGDLRNCSDKLDLPIPIEFQGENIRLAPFAPHVLRAMEKSAPSAADIRQVLSYKNLNGSDIDADMMEAACDWTLRNLQKTNLMQEDSVTYRIRLFFCRHDPDYGEYRNLSGDVFGPEAFGDVNVTLDYMTIDCENDNSITQHLYERKNERQEQNVVGWLVTELSETATQLASNVSLPLLAYGAPSAGLRPATTVRAVTGSTHTLAMGYLHLLDLCDIRRLAVLTEQTPFADQLTDMISNSHVSIRQRNVTSAESIRNALQEFRDANVRVYFVNANASVCAEVICAAEQAGMASDTNYLWLVREWRAEGRCGVTALHPIALGLAWRGAAGAKWWTNENQTVRSATVRSALDARWPRRAWPPLAAPLSDALLLLKQTLTEFVRNHPDSIYDRRVFGNAKNFDDAISGTKFKGITQKLIYNKSTYELSSPLLFIERWTGPKRALLAVWRVDGDGVHSLGQVAAPLCAPAHAAAAATCYTTCSGDEFAPKCHDKVWWISISVLVLTPIALVYARRARLHRLKLRDLALFEQLQEQRKNHSSKFSSNLVSRNQFELREELGSGVYGRVRAAVLRRLNAPALVVAAKEPAVERLQDEADLIREAGVLATLKHENIVRFMGVCLDGRALFFMEYAFFGDLRHYLRARRPLAESAYLKDEFGNDATERLDVTEASYVSAVALTKLAREAAAALEYLETQRIVHRDIRAANCLVDETRSLKLADFGLARHLAREEEYIWQNLRRLPAACMAPESLSIGVFSPASDMWALGVLMLELVTLGEPPYGRRGTADILALVRAGAHPPLPPDVSATTRHLLVWCWQRCPDKRPSARQIHEALLRHGAALSPAFP